MTAGLKYRLSLGINLSKFITFALLFLASGHGFAQSCEDLLGLSHKPSAEKILQNALQEQTQLAPVQTDVLVPQNKPAVEMILNIATQRGDQRIAQLAEQAIKNKFRQSDVIALVIEFVFSDLVEKPTPGKKTWAEGYTKENLIEDIGTPKSLNFRQGSDNPFWIPYTPKVLFYIENNGLFSHRESFLARATDMVLVGLSPKMTTVHHFYTTPAENILYHDWRFHAAHRFMGDISLLATKINSLERKDLTLLMGSRPNEIEYYREELERALNKEKKITLALDNDLQKLAQKQPELVDAAYFLLHNLVYEAWNDVVLEHRGVAVSIGLDILANAPRDRFTRAFSMEDLLKKTYQPKSKLRTMNNAKDWLVRWWLENKIIN